MSNGIDDVNIKIGADASKAINVIADLGNKAKQVFGSGGIFAKIPTLYIAAALAAKKLVSAVSELKLKTAIKSQGEQLNSFNTQLNNVLRTYDMAIYKSERMAAAIRNETQAAVARFSAWREMMGANYEIYRRGQIMPGMTGRAAFEKNLSIDQNKRGADIQYAEKVQAERERDAAAEIERLKANRAANEVRIQALRKLRNEVMAARNAIPDADSMAFDGMATAGGKMRKRINSALARTFGTNYNASDFWSNPEIQGFKGSFSELSAKLGGMITDAVKSGNATGDALKVAETRRAALVADGRANIQLMRDDDKSLTAAARRDFDYRAKVANDEREAVQDERNRMEDEAERRLEWARRMETADRAGQRKILEEREAYYKALEAVESKRLKEYEGKAEEDLTDVDKARRGRSESRLYHARGELRSIGEERRIFEKQGGDTDLQAWQFQQADRREAMAEQSRAALMGILGQGGAMQQLAAANMNGAHWLGRFNAADGGLRKLAEKYGAKDGNIESMDFRALRNNATDSALFDRLQGKADEYRGNLANSVGGILSANGNATTAILDKAVQGNRLTAMGLGGGYDVEGMVGASKDSGVEKSNELLAQILEALENNAGGGGDWGQMGWQ